MVSMAFKKDRLLYFHSKVSLQKLQKFTKNHGYEMVIYERPFVNVFMPH